MKIKRLMSFVTALLLSLSSLLFIAPKAFASTVTWTGTAGDHLFSTGGNWSGNNAPVNGDDLVFPTGVTDYTPNNDISSLSIGNITFNGGAAQQGYNITGNPITLTGGITSSIGGSSGTDHLPSLVISGTQTIATGINSVSLDGALSGSGDLTKTGTGSVFLTSDNSGYTGTITVSAGYLYAEDNNALGDTTGTTTVADGASLVLCNSLTIPENITLTGNSADTTGDYPIGKLYGTGCGQGGGGIADEVFGRGGNNSASTLSGTLTLTTDITTSVSAASLTLSGPIAGAHAISVIPGYPGQLIINSSSNSSSTPNGTYTSAPFTKTISDSVPANTVLVEPNNIITIDGTRGATTLDGGTLMGTGTVGALLVSAPATVAPGHSPGCLNSGNLTLSGTFAAEIGGADPCTGYDQINVTGTVDVSNGTLDMTRFNDFKPTAGQTYVIIKNDGNDAVTGTFQNLSEGATFSLDGFVLQISYVGGDGNDVTITVKSVPGTPNTGATLVTDHPLLTFLVISSLAGAIALIARRYKFATADK